MTMRQKKKKGKTPSSPSSVDFNGLPIKNLLIDETTAVHSPIILYELFC